MRDILGGALEGNVLGWGHARVSACVCAGWEVLFQVGTEPRAPLSRQATAHWRRVHHGDLKGS